MKGGAKPSISGISSYDTVTVSNLNEKTITETNWTYKLKVNFDPAKPKDISVELTDIQLSTVNTRNETYQTDFENMSTTWTA